MSQGESHDPIQLGLPHREPFLFVDRITKLIPGEQAVGEKTFSPEDPMFRGHFPGQPIVPGVILTEALAQTAGLAAARAGERLYLAAIKGMKFPSACKPGDIIVLRAIVRGGVAGLTQCEVSASVGERVVAEGSVVLAATASTTTATPHT